LHFILLELSKIMAPFTPFIAEEIYQKLCSLDPASLHEGQSSREQGRRSVHLEKWPKREPKIPVWPNVMAIIHRIFGTHKELRILGDMQKARDLVSLALKARMSSGIKVRQPLALLKIKTKLGNEYLELIKGEVNVKEVVYEKNLKNNIELDTKLTPELKKEGQLRELIRRIQDLRKKKGLNPKQKVTLVINANENGETLIKKFENEIKKVTSLEEIKFNDVARGEEIKIDDLQFEIAIQK